MWTRPREVIHLLYGLRRPPRAAFRGHDIGVATELRTIDLDLRSQGTDVRPEHFTRTDAHGGDCLFRQAA